MATRQRLLALLPHAHAAGGAGAETLDETCLGVHLWLFVNPSDPVSDWLTGTPVPPRPHQELNCFTGTFPKETHFGDRLALHFVSPGFRVTNQGVVADR